VFYNVSRGGSYYLAKKEKKDVSEDLILPELLSGNLSNVPEDIFLWKRSFCERKKIVPREKKIQSETSSKKSDNTSNTRATTWVKDDKTKI
jgi:hypothetical protein